MFASNLMLGFSIKVKATLMEKLISGKGVPAVEAAGLHIQGRLL
jgi:hypothetical protein